METCLNTIVFYHKAGDPNALIHNFMATCPRTDCLTSITLTGGDFHQLILDPEGALRGVTRIWNARCMSFARPIRTSSWSIETTWKFDTHPVSPTLLGGQRC